MPVKNRKTSQKQSTQSILPFGEIRNNSVVLKNGGIRGVIQTSTINFNLKSEDEQNATIASYQQFLNTLDFPIQICIQSRTVDLDPYFSLLEERKNKIENPLLKAQTEDYRNYIKKISEYAEIMEKKFFVVVPSDPLRKQAKQNVFSQLLENLSPNDSLDKVNTRYSEFKSLSNTLQQRLSIVSSGLERCGLRTNILKSKDLINLYYKSYNPKISKLDNTTDITNLTILP